MIPEIKLNYDTYCNAFPKDAADLSLEELHTRFKFFVAVSEGQPVYQSNKNFQIKLESHFQQLLNWIKKLEDTTLYWIFKVNTPKLNQSLTTPLQNLLGQLWGRGPITA